jgi:hypothetical protein
MEPHLQVVGPRRVQPLHPPRAYVRWARVEARYTAAAVVAGMVTAWLAVAGAWAPAVLTGAVMVGYVVGRHEAIRRRRLAVGLWATLAEPDMEIP